MEASIRLLLQDTRDLLGQVEWGGNADRTECVSCRVTKGSRIQKQRHRAGCKLAEKLRRLDAALRGQ